MGVENGGSGYKTAGQSMHIAFIFVNINRQLEKCGSNNAACGYTFLDYIKE